MAGRPQAKIDIEEFEKLCQMQCTEKEIAAFFGVHIDTLNNWCLRTFEDENGNPMTFKNVYADKRRGGFCSLRRAQWMKAVYDKNPTMLIWLGRNYLGQTDKGADDEEDNDVVVTIKRKGQEELTVTEKRMKNDSDEEWDSEEWEDNEEW